MANSDSLTYYHAFDNQIIPLSTKDSIPENDNAIAPSIIGWKNNQIENISASRPVDISFQPLWVLILSMVLIALMANLMHRHYKVFLLSFFVNRLKSINAEKDEKLGLFSRILSIFFILNLSVFVMKFLELGHFEMPINYGLKSFVLLTLLVFVLWLAKTLLTLSIHAIFTNWKNGIELLKISQQAELVMTLLLIPINFLFYYSFPNIEFAYFGLIILAIILFIGMSKLFFNLKEISNLHSYQIFIYLCTLEILPLMVIIKYFA